MTLIPVDTPKKTDEFSNINSYLKINERKSSENIKTNNILSLVSNNINKQLINSSSTSFPNFNFNNISKSNKSNQPSYNNINLNNINIQINIDEKSLYTDVSKKNSPKIKTDNHKINVNSINKGKEGFTNNLKLYDNSKMNFTKHKKLLNQSQNDKNNSEILDDYIKKKNEAKFTKVGNDQKITSKSSSKLEDTLPKFTVNTDNKLVSEKIYEKKVYYNNFYANQGKVSNYTDFKKIQSMNNSPSHFSVFRKSIDPKENKKNIGNILNSCTNLKFKEIKTKDCGNNIKIKENEFNNNPVNTANNHSFRINLNQVNLNKSVEKGRYLFLK